MDVPYILSVDDLGNFSGFLWESGKPSILEADFFSYEHAIEKL